MTQDTNQTSDSKPNTEDNTGTDKSIAIHYIGLDARELAIFDRVVAFNITHGLAAHKTTDIQEAELIVVNQNDYSAIESHTNKTIFMVCDVLSNENVSAQIQRPLLITKVMNTLGEAIESVKQKRLSSTAEPVEESNSPALDIIDNPDQQAVVDAVVDNSFTTLDSTSDYKDEVENTPVAPEEIVAEAEIEETKQTGHHALVIDDSASIRKQLELELRDAGITSDFAESGEDALEKVKEGQFDLIFLDIIMPGIDGYETCKQMRAMPEYKKTPIIMLSGKTSPLDEVQGVIAGATTYLTKPVKSDKLQETLNRVTKWIENFAQPKKTEIA